MVQPAPLPINPNPGIGSTSGFSGSGIPPVSSVGGPTSSYAGPHYVEKQDLTIQYTRVPEGAWYQATTTNTLSGASANPIPLMNTQIACIATARYERRKIDAIFDTSTAQNPQKFQVLAVSADYQGITYGDLNASTMGPQGTIITSQPWYYRRPWNDTQDTEIVSSVVVANFAIAASGFPSGIEAYPQTNYMSNFDAFLINPAYPHTFLYSFQPTKMGYIFPNYLINGSYTTAAETSLQLLQFIESIGSYITASQMYAIPSNVATVGYGIETVVRDSGLPLYSTARHSY